MSQDIDIVSKHGDINPKDVHPTKTAGGKFKGKDLPPYGGSDGIESAFIRCKQCGFIFDKRKHPPGSGWGNETTSSITTIAGGTANSDDPTVGAGCPLCGASNYE